MHWTVAAVVACAAFSVAACVFALTATVREWWSEKTRLALLDERVVGLDRQLAVIAGEIGRSARRVDDIADRMVRGATQDRSKLEGAAESRLASGQTITPELWQRAEALENGGTAAPELSEPLVAETLRHVEPSWESRSAVVQRVLAAQVRKGQPERVREVHRVLDVLIQKGSVQQDEKGRVRRL